MLATFKILKNYLKRLTSATRRRVMSPPMSLVFTCVTSCHMLTVNLLEAGDWSSGQVPDSMEHISSMDPVMICVFVMVAVQMSLFNMRTSRNLKY